MKKIITILSLLIWIIPALSQERAGRLQFSPETPFAGEDLKIFYNPKGGGLNVESSVRVNLYMYVDFKWSVEDILLENTDDIWIGKFNVPEKCSFIAFKFYQGNSNSPDAIDNNSEKGFTITPLDKKKRELPGAAIAVALFETPTLGTAWMNYYKDYNRQLDSRTLNQLLEKEQKIKGSDPKCYLQSYANVLKISQGEEGMQLLANLINTLLKDRKLSEEEYATLAGTASFFIKDTSLSNKVSNIILRKFPNGSSARALSYNKIREGRGSVDEGIKKRENFLEKFPVSEWRKSGNPEQHFIYYDIYRTLSSSYFDTKQYDKFLNLLPDYDFKTINEVFRWNIIRAYMFKSVPFDSLEQIARPMIKDLVSKVKDGSFAALGFRESQIEDHALEQLDNCVTTYISLLYDLNQYQEAYSYFKFISEKGKLSNPERNELYTRILEVIDEKAVLQFLESCAKVNTISPYMLNLMQSIYKANHSSMLGFETYFESFQSDSKKDEIKRYVQKQMLNVKHAPFELESLNGVVVKSSDWAGKIVVIDFWATWCRPCIDALPAMQAVVDKYANDSEVVFCFVGTMQNGNYKEKTTSFVKKEGFRLDFYLDGINPNSGEQDLVFSSFAKIFNSSGIPRKIILKDGYLRYSSEGYSGSVSMLIDEISYAIELLKEE